MMMMMMALTTEMVIMSNYHYGDDMVWNGYLP
jgi:hypothetical protein